MKGFVTLLAFSLAAMQASATPQKYSPIPSTDLPAYSSLLPYTIPKNSLSSSTAGKDTKTVKAKKNTSKESPSTTVPHTKDSKTTSSSISKAPSVQSSQKAHKGSSGKKSVPSYHGGSTVTTKLYTTVSTCSAGQPVTSICSKPSVVTVHSVKTITTEEKPAKTETSTIKVTHLSTSTCKIGETVVSTVSGKPTVVTVTKPIVITKTSLEKITQTIPGYGQETTIVDKTVIPVKKTITSLKTEIVPEYYTHAITNVKTIKSTKTSYKTEYSTKVKTLPGKGNTIVETKTHTILSTSHKAFPVTKTPKPSTVKKTIKTDSLTTLTSVSTKTVVTTIPAKYGTVTSRETTRITSTCSKGEKYTTTLEKPSPTTIVKTSTVTIAKSKTAPVSPAGYPPSPPEYSQKKSSEKSKPTHPGHSVKSSSEKAKPTPPGYSVKSSSEKPKPTPPGYSVSSSTEKSKPTPPGYSVSSSTEKSKPSPPGYSVKSSSEKPKPTPPEYSVSSSTEKPKPTPPGYSVKSSSEKAKQSTTSTVYTTSYATTSVTTCSSGEVKTNSKGHKTTLTKPSVSIHTYMTTEVLTKPCSESSKTIEKPTVYQSQETTKTKVTAYTTYTTEVVKTTVTTCPSGHVVTNSKGEKSTLTKPSVSSKIYTTHSTVSKPVQYSSNGPASTRPVYTTYTTEVTKTTVTTCSSGHVVTNSKGEKSTLTKPSVSSKVYTTHSTISKPIQYSPGPTPTSAPEYTTGYTTYTTEIVKTTLTTCPSGHIITNSQGHKTTLTKPSVSSQCITTSAVVTKPIPHGYQPRPIVPPSTQVYTTEEIHSTVTTCPPGQPITKPNGEVTVYTTEVLQTQYHTHFSYVTKTNGGGYEYNTVKVSHEPVVSPTVTVYTSGQTIVDSHGVTSVCESEISTTQYVTVAPTPGGGSSGGYGGSSAPIPLPRPSVFGGSSYIPTTPAVGTVGSATGIPSSATIPSVPPYHGQPTHPVPIYHGAAPQVRASGVVGLAVVLAFGFALL